METFTLYYTKDRFELPETEVAWALKREIGYSPVQLLAISAAGCGGYVYHSVLNKSNIPHQFHKAEVTYQRDEQTKTNPISHIQMTFYVSVEQAFQEKAVRCLKLVAPNCPVIQSLDKQIVMTEQVVFV